MFNQTFYQQLPSMIQETIAHGASYCPTALPTSLCENISAEVRQDDFVTLTPKQGRPVIEDMDIFKFVLAQDKQHPQVRMLGHELATCVSSALGRSWNPNEASFHRYHAGTQALGKHRDFKSDLLFVAVFTISGSGGFELLADDGSVERSWDCSGGGLCLMRAPGLTDAEDDRPLHRALPPQSGTREALIYREVVGDYLGKLV